MALFGTKKNKEVAVKKDASATGYSVKGVILAPHVTEKAGVASEHQTYTFDVTKNATKGLVFRAIKEMYNVTPVKVTMATLPRVSVLFRGTKGMTSGGKKAYVHLKKGDKIEFI